MRTQLVQKIHIEGYPTRVYLRYTLGFARWELLRSWELGCQMFDFSCELCYNIKGAER